MGGEFEFMCFPQPYLSQREVEGLFNEAFEEAKRIEHKFSDFIDSPFNHINKLAGEEACPVDRETMDLVLKSIEVSKKSDGIFDISFASVGHIWRDYKSKKQSMPTSLRTELLKEVDYRKIQIDESNLTVYLPSKKMRIGLGGIGKGYAVDRCFEMLQRNGVINFYVNGSGDIRFHAHKDAPRPWKMGIRNPFVKDQSRSAGLIQLHNGAVATSGSYIHTMDRDKSYKDHHVLNLNDEKKTEYIVSTTVIADTCTDADTTATILMSMTPDQGVRFLDQNSRYGVIIDHTGRTHLSKKTLKSFRLVDKGE
jgi:thiamine biosynthesis lipoprotein